MFATLNTALYWMLKPVLNLATLGALGFIMPFVANMLFLYVTLKIFEKKKWFEIDGLIPTLWMAGILTLVHGALWVGLDYIPKHV